MFELKKPCDNCPFRRSGGVRLTSGRIADIAGMMLSEDGGAFWCHKTTDSVDDDLDSSGHRSTIKSQHCAGALIFAEKNGVTTQAMRIAKTLDLYRPDMVLDDQTTVDQVFDSLAEMLETQCR